MRAARSPERGLLRAAALSALLGLLLHLGIMASPAHAEVAANTTGHLQSGTHGRHAGQASATDATGTTGAGHVSGPHHLSPGDRSSVPAAPRDADTVVLEGAGSLARPDHPRPATMPDDCAISPAPARGVPSFAPPPLGERLVLARVGPRPLAAAPRTRWPAARPPPGGRRAFLQVFLI